MRTKERYFYKLKTKKLSQDLVLDIKTKFRDGYTPKEIIELYPNIKFQTIYGILRETTYKQIKVDGFKPIVREYADKYKYGKYSDLDNKMGVYCFYNKITHKKYIGSSKNIYKRIRSHFICCHYNTNNYKSSYNSEFYTDLRTYDFDDWYIYCVEEIKNNDIIYLRKREKYYINYFNTVNDGYNKTFETVNTLDYKNGEDNHNAILTNKEVYEIREDYKNGVKKKDCYQKYLNKMHWGGFTDVWNGRTYKDVHMDVYTDENKNFQKTNVDKSGVDNPRAKLNEQQVKEIRLLYDNGMSISNLCKMFSIGKTAMRGVCKRESYKEVV